jgi:hypothetical protein
LERGGREGSATFIEKSFFYPTDSTPNLNLSFALAKFLDKVSLLLESFHSQFDTVHGNCDESPCRPIHSMTRLGNMRQNLKPSGIGVLAAVLVLSSFLGAATKVHVITFGKWIAVQWLAASASPSLASKVRPLLVDGRVKEYVVGSPHEITDRLFVVRRAFRINDALPEESVASWHWQRGGWLLVDRFTGRVSPASLPSFDPDFSAASWYQDYAAYCGIGDDGKKTYAVVAQLSRRKPVLKKLLPSVLKDDPPQESICPAPQWQRNPVRVSFAPDGGDKQTFAIRGTAVDLVSDAEEED